MGGRVEPDKARVVTSQFKMDSCHSSASGLEDINKTLENLVKSEIDAILE